MNSLPSQQFLLDCLNYDPMTGDLVWKLRNASTFVDTPNRSAERQAKNFNARFAGKPAFTSATKLGYLRGTLCSEFYYAHRIIWKMVHGTDPEHIDHINGDPSDNRLANLRSVLHADNTRNRCLSSNNTSGHHGVSFSKTHKLWQAVIEYQGERHHLGWFKDLPSAVAVRASAELQFGFHANHGRH